MTSERQITYVTVATANDEVTSLASVDDATSSTVSSQQLTQTNMLLGTATLQTDEAMSNQSPSFPSQSAGMSETTTSGSTTTTTFFEAATTTHHEVTETDAANIQESSTNLKTSQQMSSIEQTTSGADATTAQQMSTSEQTSSELTTVSQATLTSSPPPDVHCCCRCCFPSTLSCKVCEGDTLTDAAECAKQEPKTIKPLDRNTPNFEPPFALEGSKHPERLAYREDFIKLEQLTETLAALPESQKIELGFKSGDLIMDCMYDGSPCSVEELV